MWNSDMINSCRDSISNKHYAQVYIHPQMVQRGLRVDIIELLRIGYGL